MRFDQKEKNLQKSVKEFAFLLSFSYLLYFRLLVLIKFKLFIVVVVLFFFKKKIIFLEFYFILFYFLCLFLAFGLFETKHKTKQNNQKTIIELNFFPFFMFFEF